MLFGIDLGGTKTEVIVLKDDDYKELFRKRVPTVKRDYGMTLKTIKTLINDAMEATGERCEKFGVAIPGAQSRVDGSIKNANSWWLNGRHLKEDLANETNIAVVLANDANCFALSEAVDGAGAGYETVWGLILGTGSGTGIVVNSQVLEGPNAISGEWGHNPLPWQNEYERKLSTTQQCYCKKQGCIETFISGTGFELEYERQSGRQLTGIEIAARMAAGESGAVKAFELYSDRLARCIACFANFLDPDVIVLGGGMSNLAQLYGVLPNLIREHIFGGEFSTPIVKAKHGDSSGVRGAAFLTAKSKPAL